MPLGWALLRDWYQEQQNEGPTETLAIVSLVLEWGVWSGRQWEAIQRSSLRMFTLELVEVGDLGSAFQGAWRHQG